MKLAAPSLRWRECVFAAAFISLLRLEFGSANHRLGALIFLEPAVVVGPDSGEDPTEGNLWKFTFLPDPNPDITTKYLILGFTSSNIEDEDRVEIDLEYDVDVFTSSSGSSFWTRPIKGGSTTIVYVNVDGNGSGGVELFRYGRGEEIDIFMVNPGLFVEPTFWSSLGVCDGDDPTWENVDCLEPGLMEDVARSVGIVVYGIESGDKLGSCTGTLIDEDLILTAGHCISPDTIESASASFTFDFQTDCDGFPPEGYSPHFYKVTRVVTTGFEREVTDPRPPIDYMILQIDAEGLGIPSIPIRDTLPEEGDDMFIIHHPRGTAKKISRRETDPECYVQDIFDGGGGCPPGTHLAYGCDIDNGSSGSSAFDLSGRIVAETDWWPCTTCSGLLASTSILEDIVSAPPPLQDIDVMLALDRSGSMSLPGESGDTKMDEAKEAAALFIDLLTTDASHKVGLVSFSSTSILDYGLSSVTSDTKEELIGPIPHDEGKVGDLTPGGATTIGGGLQTAQAQFEVDSPNKPVILLMTDGLQNTAPFIEDVEDDLENSQICAIGFGSEASLDGPLLTRLAREQDGLYTRAGDGLELKKFFVLCFGNIFNTGISSDPYYTIQAGSSRSDPIPLQLCSETRLTVVIGWNRTASNLGIELRSPTNVAISSSTAGVESSSGSTWAILRIPFPFGGERDGTWTAYVIRDQTRSNIISGEDVFFLTAVIDGGPTFRPITPPRLYTGDPINPLVRLLEPSGSLVPADVTVELKRPGEGTGNLLRASGIMSGGQVDSDSLDARTNKLIMLESENGTPLIPVIEDRFDLFDDGEHEDGAIEPDGIFGDPLEDITRFEGTYTLRSVAAFKKNCDGTRETTWSTYVEVGIDPTETEVEVEIVELLPNGRIKVRFTFTPRDRFGNYVGPGRYNDSFDVGAAVGSDIVGEVNDNLNGSYAVEVMWDPSIGSSPAVEIRQAERSPVVVIPAENLEPICSRARASVSNCWPPNHKFVPVQVLDVVDPNGDTVLITIKEITQDEPVAGRRDGKTCPDGVLVDKDDDGNHEQVAVRCERSGRGDGRVYNIYFTAADLNGGECNGFVKVCVPHSQSQKCIENSSESYDSNANC